ncbi:hypothetical protein DB347_14045 [Opitutaceae bacterium EW11]|nr:hypothetical protein DB347_14045 [Opitutaceae bacterium EW11]
MLTWTSDFETGIEAIDADHLRLIGGLNELEGALADGQGSARISGVLQFLEIYAAEHFAREEQCMNRFRCPAAAANKKAHEQFVAKFSAAKSRIANSPGSCAYVAAQTHRELCDWVVTHILRVDLSLRGCTGQPKPSSA